jgi:transcriptional regulator with GAF, ATPase, and Fis domain
MAQVARNIVDELPPRFTEVCQVAEGGQGGAFVAVDTQVGRRVALKRAVGPQRRELSRACAVLRRTASPHLPAIVELFDAGEATWLATAWVDGEPLEAGPVPMAEALAEAHGVAHALAALHAAGTHHGDVSAGNVLRTATRGVVLTDLATLGVHGCGTPGFFAPEVLAGGGGAAADRFSLGCLLCLRIFGQVPWRTAEALVTVRSNAQVRQRVAALAAEADVAVPRGVADLLERLLAPDPAERVRDAGLLVERLALLQNAARAGTDVLALPWWLPARFPWRGPSLAPLLEQLSAEDRPHLLLVVGPAGSGRTRAAEEIVLALQERGSRVARLVDASAIAEALGRPDVGWLEAWMAPAAPVDVLAVVGDPRFPGEDSPTERTALRAALLAAAVGLSGCTLVLRVGPELAEALHGTPGVARLDVRAWSIAEVEAALAGVLDRDAEVGFAAALHEVTAGWPARTVRLIESAARHGLARPDVRALARLADEPAGVDVALARRIFDARWGEPEAALPGHVVSPQGPLAPWVAAARRALGPQVGELARERVAERRRRGLCVPEELWLDAQDVDTAAEHLRAAWEADAPLSGAAIDFWSERPGRLDDRLAAFVLAELVRRADTQRALEVGARWTGGPEVALQVARALQQRGRPADALATLEAAPAPGDAAGRWRRMGLSLRLQVDLGRAAAAVESARSALDPTAATGTAGAAAWSWAALAAQQVGDLATADAWLSAAARCLDAAPPERREVASAWARILQLRANLADGRDELAHAAELYRAARAAFERAGEPVGELFARSSLAALAFPTGEIAEGVEHGRAALRGLVARAQAAAVPVALFNLVQCLCRTGAVDEARRWRDAGAGLLAAAGEPTALARARMQRVDAQLDPSDPADVALSAAARALAGAGAAGEAAHAFLAAAAAARVGGDPDRARDHLDLAGEAARDIEDLSLRVGLALERVAQAEDASQLESALEALRALPSPARLRTSGHLEVAFTYDRTLLAALHERGAAGDRSARSVARRLLHGLEALMTKVPDLDRAAVRRGLLSDAGDPSPLRQLARELEEDAAALDTAAPREVPHEPAARAENAEGPGRLIRMYRRLAREDRLEPLLEQVVDAMMELTDAERGVVVVRMPGDEDLEVTRELAGDGEDVGFSRSVIGRVLESAAPVISVDAAQDERFGGARSISHLNLRSVLAVPLVFRGEVLGAAYVDHRLRRGAFDDADLARVEDFADLAALAVANARALRRVSNQAADLERQGRELAQMLERRDAEVEGLRETVRHTSVERPAYRGMFGTSERMQQVFRLVDRVADSDVPVVVYGESGTGKELVARAIHAAGSRHGGPFVAENCGAIPETLLESVLFGHARGSFTGAQKAKPGLFEAAHGGTIFLDEVGETSPAMQTKLLRVLQEGEVRRIGENTPRKVDVRVITASNRDLEAMVREGTFRQDLYYRIHVVRIELPPLRARPGDVPVLVDHFLERHGSRRLEVSAAAMRLLLRHAWPGNVRELENEVQRWLALVEDRVRPEDLSLSVRGDVVEGEPDPDDLHLRTRVDRLERDLIARALERTGGNQTQAAQLLGLSRFGLQKKLRRLHEGGDDEPT